jgi:hypothetical protein
MIYGGVDMSLLSDVTSFPSDGYRGIVLEKDIPVVSHNVHTTTKQF